MLIELHILQNHSPSNLNRDESGSPKTAMFGGSSRARISSQCIKRSIRRSPLFQEILSEGKSFRTRQLPELVRARLMEMKYSAEDALRAAKLVSGLGNKDRKEQPPADNGSLATAQTMFISDADVDATTNWAIAQLKQAPSGKTSKGGKKKADDSRSKESNQLEAPRPIPLEIALFGRMVTDDAFRDVDSAIQVAHAISTHTVEQEYDYFTAVDDLRVRSSGDDMGADMIGDVEFNSACYYKYFSIDVDALVANLTGEGPYKEVVGGTSEAEARKVAGEATRAFVIAAAMVTPSGKQNTFAANQLPSLVLAEVRPRKAPVSYANAFVNPARNADGSDLVGSSIRNLAGHARAMTSSFGLRASERLLLEPESSLFEFEDSKTSDWSGVRVSNLQDLAERLQRAVGNG